MREEALAVDTIGVPQKNRPHWLGSTIPKPILQLPTIRMLPMQYVPYDRFDDTNNAIRASIRFSLSQKGCSMNSEDTHHEYPKYRYK